jgi:hypothetical protein
VFTLSVKTLPWLRASLSRDCSGLSTSDIFWKKHSASEWLEDRGENEYFLDTDGTFYAYEGGAPVPLVQLNHEDVERLSGN